MPLLERPRLTAVFPVLAVLVAAALLLLVALSIALQPPDTSDADRVTGALAWARALLFAGGSLAFAVGILAFAQARTDAEDGEDARPQAAGDEAAGLVAPASLVRYGEEGSMRFTLIALGANADDARAIADFYDPRELLTTARLWHTAHPREELRIFGPDGVEIARRAPAVAPAVRPASAATRRSRPRAGLATGGA